VAQWLWTQIAKVVPTVAAESPFAAAALTWRIYQLLKESDWTSFPRLEHYLKDPNSLRRYWRTWSALRRSSIRASCRSGRAGRRCSRGCCELKDE